MANTTRTEPQAFSSIGVDIGKDVFHLVGFDRSGQIVLRRKIKRLALVSTFETLSPCIVGMEACLSAHFVSRTLRKLGFEPRIIPAKYTKPFVKGQKNDYNDAEAIAEAALRPNLNLVAEKTPGSARPAGPPQGALPPGLKANSNDQPDPGLPDRTGHRRTNRCPCPAQLAVCHPEEPCRRDVPAHECHYHRPSSGLARAG